jgi:excisionase family DNA binding protein
MNLLKVPEVAGRLNCSESFVYQAIASGELRHYRLGKGQGGIRVSEEQIGEYLAPREKGGGAKAPKLAQRSRPLKHLSLE